MGWVEARYLAELLADVVGVGAGGAVLAGRLVRLVLVLKTAQERKKKRLSTGRRYYAASSAGPS